MTSKLSPEEEKRLTEAACILRLSPAFPLIEKYLQALLAETKDRLVTNQSPHGVPNLQGRAQQLIDVLELLNRKHK